MSISRKFAVWIISIIFVIGALSAYLYYRKELPEEMGRFERLGRMVGPILEEGLDNNMISRDMGALDRKLNNFKELEPISRILLVNGDGVVKASTDKAMLGLRLSDSDRRCRRCHDASQKGLFITEENVFRWIQPVKNKPECFGCHGSSTKNNGVFIIDFSLLELEKYVKDDILRGFLIFAFSLFFVGLSTILLSNSLVSKRLNKVVEKLGKFKEGDYGVRIPLKGSDEITNLSEGFNEMAEAINAREREKDLLFKQIVRSQKEWQGTFDSITDLISIHDEDYNIIKVNKAFAEYFGLSPKDVINKKCYEYFHDIMTPVEGCPHKISLVENRPATTEMVNPKNNRVFRITTYPFHFTEAEFRGTIHIVRDITDEREKEMRLIVSERLGSLGQMAAGIAHEINNPLAAIAGCAEGLSGRVKKGKFEPDLFENYLNIIAEEVMRCKSITTGMLSFARKTTYEKKDVDINETLDKSLEIIGFQGRLGGVKIAREYNKPVIIRGSEGELRQVFLAIIANALDAMEDTGALTISTAIEEGRAVIKICDTGPGIPHEHLGKIFDPFFTTKSETGGTGLGLPIASKIISNHNGNISVKTEKGAGTTFIISLPI